MSCLDLRFRRFVRALSSGVLLAAPLSAISTQDFSDLVSLRTDTGSCTACYLKLSWTLVLGYSLPLDLQSWELKSSDW